jgi:hypothetical protein
MHRIYPTEKLQEICTELFYDHMATIVKGKTVTNAHIKHKEYNELVLRLTERTRTYKQSMQKYGDKGDIEVSQSIQRSLKYLVKYKECIINSSMEFQRETYKNTGDMDFSRTYIKFPLKDRINPIYDDFELEVVFYDDVCTLKGKFKEYKNLKTKEERISFLKENTEITHMSLQLNMGDLRVLIGVQGTIKMQKRALDVLVLPNKYSDLTRITDELVESLNNRFYKNYKKVSKHFRHPLEVLKAKIDLDGCHVLPHYIAKT